MNRFSKFNLLIRRIVIQMKLMKYGNKKYSEVDDIGLLISSTLNLWISCSIRFFNPKISMKNMICIWEVQIHTFSYKNPIFKRKRKTNISNWSLSNTIKIHWKNKKYYNLYEWINSRKLRIKHMRVKMKQNKSRWHSYKMYQYSWRN